MSEDRLFGAISTGCYHRVRVVLACHKLIDFSRANATGESPLHAAYRLDAMKKVNSRSIIRLLVLNGCSPNVTDRHGRSLLSTCCCEGDVSMFNFLMDTYEDELDLRAQDFDGNTVFHHAVLVRSDESLARLLDCAKRHKIVVNVDNHSKMTPYLLAKRAKYEKGIALIEQKCGKQNFQLMLLHHEDRRLDTTLDLPASREPRARPKSSSHPSPSRHPPSRPTSGFIRVHTFGVGRFKASEYKSLSTATRSDKGASSSAPELNSAFSSAIVPADKTGLLLGDNCELSKRSDVPENEEPLPSNRVPSEQRCLYLLMRLKVEQSTPAFFRSTQGSSLALTALGAESSSSTISSPSKLPQGSSIASPVLGIDNSTISSNCTEEVCLSTARASSFARRVARCNTVHHHRSSSILLDSATNPVALPSPPRHRYEQER